MPPRTVLRLPEEHDGRAGYKHYTDGEASYVLVPEAEEAEPARVGLAPETVVEIIAPSLELADASLKAELGEIDRRLRARRSTGRVIQLRPVEKRSHLCDGREDQS